METLQPEDYLQLMKYIYNRSISENDFMFHETKYSKILIDVCKKYSVDTIVKIINYVSKEITRDDTEILKIVCGEKVISIESFVEFVYNHKCNYGVFTIIEGDFNLFPEFTGDLEAAITFAADHFSEDRWGMESCRQYFIKYFSTNSNVYSIVTKLLLRNYNDFIIDLWLNLSNNINFDDFCKLQPDVLLLIKNNCNKSIDILERTDKYAMFILVLEIHGFIKLRSIHPLNYFDNNLTPEIKDKFVSKFVNINWLSTYDQRFLQVQQLINRLLLSLSNIIQSANLSLGIKYILKLYL